MFLVTYYQESIIVSYCHIVHQNWAYQVVKPSCSPIKGTVEWSSKHLLVRIKQSKLASGCMLIASFNNSFDRVTGWLLYLTGSFLMDVYGSRMLFLLLCTLDIMHSWSCMPVSKYGQFDFLIWLVAVQMSFVTGEWDCKWETIDDNRMDCYFIRKQSWP